MHFFHIPASLSQIKVAAIKHVLNTITYTYLSIVDWMKTTPRVSLSDGVRYKIQMKLKQVNRSVQFIVTHS